jgi:hypothetical protein
MANQDANNDQDQSAESVDFDAFLNFPDSDPDLPDLPDPDPDPSAQPGEDYEIPEVELDAAIALLGLHDQPSINKKVTFADSANQTPASVSKESSAVRSRPSPPGSSPYFPQVSV